MVATAIFPPRKECRRKLLHRTLNGAHVPLPLLTMTSTGPVLASAGATTLSCVALM